MTTTETNLNLRQTRINNLLRWFKKVPLIPVLLLSPLLVWGIFGPLLYPQPPDFMDLSRALQPPAWLPGGTMTNCLGTDQLGRDLLSRLMAGARTSLLVAVFGVLISGFIGVAVGMISGYFGGKTDQVIMRIVDTWMAIPGVFFMLLFVALMRQIGIQGLTPIILSISITMWVGYARMTRGEVLSIKQREYVAMATVIGCSNFRILTRHIFPGIVNTVVVIATTQIGGAIMAEAGMSFLGVGVQPPDTAWGSLISESSTYMGSAWWIPTFAGLAITVTILGANLFGDWLRDALDPVQRQRQI